MKFEPKEGMICFEDICQWCKNQKNCRKKCEDFKTLYNDILRFDGESFLKLYEKPQEAR